MRASGTASNPLPSVPASIASLICNVGKHRLRWLVIKLRDWLAGNYGDSDSWIHVEHLREGNRRQEVNHYYVLLGRPRLPQTPSNGISQGHGTSSTALGVRAYPMYFVPGNEAHGPS